VKGFHFNTFKPKKEKKKRKETVPGKSKPCCDGPSGKKKRKITANKFGSTTKRQGDLTFCKKKKKKKGKTDPLSPTPPTVPHHSRPEITQKETRMGSAQWGKKKRGQRRFPNAGEL